MLNQKLRENYSKAKNTVTSDEVLKYCKVLGLNSLTGQDDLKKAYKIMIKQWHPDRFQNRPDIELLAIKKTQLLNKAYRFLLDELEKHQKANTSKGSQQNWKNNRHNYSWQTYTDGFPDPEAVEFFLNSSHIVSTGYNKTKKILFIKFLGDEIFLYFDVPIFIFDHLLKAQSPGKYAMRFIYNRFRHRKFISITRNLKHFL